MSYRASRRMRRLVAASAAWALAASPAAAAPDWRAARASVGYRLTAGSRDYVGNAILGRASLPLDEGTSAYTRLDLSRDRSYERAVSWVLGAERDLTRRWLGWAGAGLSGAELQDGGSASSFLFEAGAGRPMGRWWSDAEYRLTSGEVGRVLPYGAKAQGPSPSPRSGGMQASMHEGGHGGGGGQPVLSAPSETGESFEQHELGLFIGSPVYRVLRPLSFGLSASAWRRTGGLEGLSAGADASIRVAPRWSLLLGTSADFPSRGSRAAYGSAGLRYALSGR